MVAFRDRDKPAPEMPATLDGLRKQGALLQLSGADSEVMKSIQARREDFAPMLKQASDPAIREKLKSCLDALAGEDEVDNPEALALLEVYRADPPEWRRSQGIEFEQEIRTLVNRLEELAKKGEAMPETVMQKVYDPCTFSRSPIRGVFKASVMMQCNGGPERTYAQEAADMHAVSCGGEDDVNPEYRSDNSDEVFSKELADREVRRIMVCEFMLKKMRTSTSAGCRSRVRWTCPTSRRRCWRG